MHAPRAENEPTGLLAGTYQQIDDGIRAGWHTGAQVFAAQEGTILADFGRGEARAGVPMTPETLMLWFSSGKPITATAILQLHERGQLSLQDPVARHVPEFAQHGKDAFTLWHLLTHTAGFRWVEINWPHSSWDEIIARICAARPEPRWVVGEKAGYSAFTSWYILGEVARRVDGRAYSDYVRQEIFLPLGMRDSWVGMPLEQYQAYGDRMGAMLETDKQPPQTHRYATPAGTSACVPGGNACGPIRELGRFYQMLLGGGELDGVRVLSPESVRQMTTRQREGLYDYTFRHTMDWGLGLIINSARYGADTVPYGFGPYSSPESFGHGGVQSSVGFADPERKLAVGVVFNGMPGEQAHHVRMNGLLAALFEDLGLDGR